MPAHKQTNTNTQQLLPSQDDERERYFDEVERRRSTILYDFEGEEVPADSSWHGSGTAQDEHPYPQGPASDSGIHLDSAPAMVCVEACVWCLHVYGYTLSARRPQ